MMSSSSARKLCPPCRGVGRAVSSVSSVTGRFPPDGISRPLLLLLHPGSPHNAGQNENYDSAAVRKLNFILDWAGGALCKCCIVSPHLYTCHPGNTGSHISHTRPTEMFSKEFNEDWLGMKNLPRDLNKF